MGTNEVDLSQTADAQVWAREFVRIGKEVVARRIADRSLVWRGSPTDFWTDIADEGWLIGWFANAMQAAVNAKLKTAERPEPSVVESDVVVKVDLGELQGIVQAVQDRERKRIAKHTRNVIINELGCTKESMAGELKRLLSHELSRAQSATNEAVRSVVDGEVSRLVRSGQFGRLVAEAVAKQLSATLAGQINVNLGKAG